ncbi:NAD(P)/FAD-dependent oxidoreductase [Mycoavidus sp. B2-EB]|uniref:NAD(P)/FAD-dependent oxidoreductase n=1 Tax=Mycoavidus sp. B2-EB TaxID=2651972 RepID=UPI0016232370|nr:NAD(P)/FAD-dependent oxidoreductase [Mycoavidus sp. B2-EB]BBO59684.1 NADH dehydrogenase [Mycoavidus sp. B2-EB]
MHRIVIVGGGAGGLELATRLGDRFGARQTAHIVLVDAHPTHLWKPLLHEVAAGSMDPFTHQLEYAAQAHWHHFEFRLGALSGLDRLAKKITLAAVDDMDGAELLPSRELAYDTLVIAIGSATHFFDVVGAQQYALALDTVAQAQNCHRHLLAACMRAHANPQPYLQIAIVGGGATGVELSAQLRQTAQILATYGVSPLDPKQEIRIVIIEAGPRILSALPERVSKATTTLLAKLNIEIILNEQVASVSEPALLTVSGKTIPTHLTIWAAGIKAPAILSQLDGLATNPRGQLKVCATLQTESDPDIFAFGDCASCPWPEKKTIVPPRAQAAHQQANFLLHALTRRLKGASLPNFRYRDFGSLVSLGHFSAVGNLMGGIRGGNLFIEGLFARLMYTSLYRMHIAALHGFVWMVTDTLAHWLRRSTVPRVKLH